MNILVTRMLLFADRSAIFRDMGSGFREKRESFQPTDLLWWLLAAALLAGAFIALATILASQDKSRLFNSPRALFNALCKAHRLDRTSRNLLKQLAQSQQLMVPARLFLEAERFDPALLPMPLQSQRDQIAALRDRLFRSTTAES